MVSVAGPILGALGITAAMIVSVWIFRSRQSRVSLHHKSSMELQSRSTLPHQAEGAPSILVRGPRPFPYRRPFHQFLQAVGPHGGPQHPLQNFSPDRGTATANGRDIGPLFNTPIPQLQVVEYQRMVDDLELQAREDSGLPPPYPAAAADAPPPSHVSAPGSAALNQRVREYQRLVELGRGVRQGVSISSSASRTPVSRPGATTISNLPAYGAARDSNDESMGTHTNSQPGAGGGSGGVDGETLAVPPPTYTRDIQPQSVPP